MKTILSALIVLATFNIQTVQACPEHDAAGQDQQTSTPAPVSQAQ